MLNSLYKKSLKLAAHKSSKFFLAILSFAESSFFPIPPDIMIIPMVVAKKNDYLKIFLIATFSSAAGGLLGYLIGSVFLDLAMNVIEIYGYDEKVVNIKILKPIIPLVIVNTLKGKGVKPARNRIPKKKIKLLPLDKLYFRFITFSS